jgi:hypothetical protein
VLALGLVFMAGFLGCEYADALLDNPPQKDPPKEEPEEEGEEEPEEEEKEAIPALKTVYVAAGNDGAGDGSEENPYLTVTQALNAIKTAYAQDDWPNEGKGEIIILGTVTTGPGIAITSAGGPYPPIVLCGENGGTVDLVGENSIDNPRPLITVGAGVTLTLRNITLKGLKSGNPGDNNNNTWSLIWVNSGGTLILETGASIKDNTRGWYDNTGGAGGVTVYGALIMNSGEISGMRTTSKFNHGGGVYVGNGGTFTMKSGTISGNKIDDRAAGGGVYVNTSGKFTLEGGTISGNNASTEGGGVYVNTGGTFTMRGGTISSNTSNGNGVGVISGGSGGGVYVNASGTFTMENGNIENNKSMTSGGGVGVYAGTFTMSGGTIANNECVHYGGGVFGKGGAKITMNNGEISGGNQAPYTGGGVHVREEGTTFTMRGGTISGNNGGGGGGVGADKNGTFTMSGGTISGNYAYTGGGVQVQGGAKFTKTGGGIIYGDTDTTHTAWADENTATTGGGHAVCFIISGSDTKYRNSPAYVGDDLDTTKTGAFGGWDQ